MRPATSPVASPPKASPPEVPPLDFSFLEVPDVSSNAYFPNVSFSDIVLPPVELLHLRFYDSDEFGRVYIDESFEEDEFRVTTYVYPEPPGHQDRPVVFDPVFKPKIDLKFDTESDLGSEYDLCSVSDLDSDPGDDDWKVNADDFEEAFHKNEYFVQGFKFVTCPPKDKIEKLVKNIFFERTNPPLSTDDWIFV